MDSFSEPQRQVALIPSLRDLFAAAPLEIQREIVITIFSRLQRATGKGKDSEE
jgi:hypothetical protein